jgi:hypothetical protein
MRARRDPLREAGAGLGDRINPREAAGVEAKRAGAGADVRFEAQKSISA